MPEWNELFKENQFRWPNPDERVMRFTARLQTAGLHSVLDLGCGAGRHTLFLAQQGLAVYGLDDAPNGLLAARQRLQTNGQSAGLACGDMGDLPFADAAFDAVVSVYVIHHNRLARIQRTVQEIRRVLRPGGLAMLDLNATASWRYRNERSIEVEPGTFIPTEGPETGVPHHYFDEAAARDAFSCLRILELYLNEQDFRDPSGAVRHHGQWTAILTS
jgi:tellurite methyltransferase